MIDCRLCNNNMWLYNPTTDKACRCQCYSQRRVETILSTGFIPPRYLPYALDAMSAENPAQVDALAVLLRYADEWPERLMAGDGVALMGATSRAGKTHLACALARTIVTRYDLPYEPGEKYPLLFMNTSDFINGWRTYFAQPKTPDGTDNSQHWGEYKRLMMLEQRAQTCPLLILDEVGEATGTEFVTGKLYSIIDRRSSCLLPIVITTNLSWEQLALRYGDGGARIVGRLQEMTAVFSIRL